MPWARGWTIWPLGVPPNPPCSYRSLQRLPEAASLPCRPLASGRQEEGERGAGQWEVCGGAGVVARLSWWCTVCFALQRGLWQDGRHAAVQGWWHVSPGDALHLSGVRGRAGGVWWCRGDGTRLSWWCTVSSALQRGLWLCLLGSARKPAPNAVWSDTELPKVQVYYPRRLFGSCPWRAGLCWTLCLCGGTLLDAELLYLTQESLVWYESSRSNKLVPLHNLMGIYLTKCWAWFIKTAFCAANYWRGLYSLKGVICVCIGFISDFLRPTIALWTNTWLDISTIPG